MESLGDKVNENAKARSPAFQLDIAFGQGKRFPQKGVVLQEDNKNTGHSEVTSGLLKRKYPDTSEENSAKKTRSEYDEKPAVSKRPEASKFPKLYRLLRNGDDISQGLMAKQPNGNESVARHVATGSKRGSSSQFLSTCCSLENAESFRRLKLRSRYFKWGNKDIAEIDVGSLPDDVKIIDLRTKTLRRLHETGDSDTDALFHKFAESHKEVLLVGKVPPSCLTLHTFTGTVPPDTDSDSDNSFDSDNGSASDDY